MSDSKKNRKQKKKSPQRDTRRATILGAAFVAVVGGGIGGGLFALNRKGAKDQNEPKPQRTPQKKPPKS